MSLYNVRRRPSFLVAVGLIVLVAVVWTITSVRAAQPKSLDQRTYDVTSQIQCPVCNGESVADSSSAVAQEMRDVARQKLAAGASEQQVMDYFRVKYTDAILESPPKDGFTSLIWVIPFVALLAGLLLLFSLGREWQSARVASEAGPREDDLDQTLPSTEHERYRRLLQRELDADEGLPVGRGKEAL